MRPRKRILLVAVSGRSRRIHRLRLGVWNYAVSAPRTYAEVHEELRRGGCAAVLFDGVPDRRVRSFARTVPDMPLVVIGAAGPVMAYRVQSGGPDHAFVLRDRLRIAVARKRGPKPVLKPVQERAA